MNRGTLLTRLLALAAGVLLAAGGADAAPPAKRTPAEVAALVDKAIDAKLAEAKVKPAGPADDAEFLRRAYLDLTGVIPTADAAKAFFDSKDPDKRAKLIDELLASPAAVRHAAEQWAALLTADEPANRPKLEAWLAESFTKGRGWDEVVRDLLTATGAGPETGFVLSNVENKVPQPEKLARSTARLFLGVQLQCAECHDHPFSDWKQTDFWALAAFFSRTAVLKQPPGLGEAPKALRPLPRKGRSRRRPGPSSLSGRTRGRRAAPPSGRSSPAAPSPRSPRRGRSARRSPSG